MIASSKILTILFFMALVVGLVGLSGCAQGKLPAGGQTPAKTDNTGDVELILKQDGNNLTGSVRVYNPVRYVKYPDKLREEQERSSKLKQALGELGGGDIPVPKGAPVEPEPQLGGTIVNGKVWANHLRFKADQTTWEGDYTTDTMTGSVKRAVGTLSPGDPGINGTFFLFKKSGGVSGQPFVSPTSTPTSTSPTPTTTFPLPSGTPPKPASLLCSDADYYNLYTIFKNWGLDFNALYEAAVGDAIATYRSLFWIGDKNNESRRIYFSRVGDKWQPITTAPQPTTSTSPTPTPGWQTHTYSNKEMGFALSFATPAEWLATGPVGERQIGGWYDPRYPKPPDPAAAWCYWITCRPPRQEPDDPIMLAPSQKRVTAHQVQGNWSYHLMCVAPMEIFGQQVAVFNKIMESFKPLP